MDSLKSTCEKIFNELEELIKMMWYLLNLKTTFNRDFETLKKYTIKRKFETKLMMIED